MRRVAVVVVLVALALPGAARSATITVRAPANGKTVRLHEGDVLVVVLRGNSSTGYSWDVQRLDRRVLRRLSTSFVPDRPGCCGIPGVFRLRFRARGRGTTLLRLRYERSFSPTHHGGTFAIRAVVR